MRTKYTLHISKFGIDKYDPVDKEINRSGRLVAKLNKLCYRNKEEKRLKLLRELFGHFGTDSKLPNLIAYCEVGSRVYIGSRTYINNNVSFVGGGDIRIGNNCWIGPNVTFVTITHPMDSIARAKGDMEIEGITIEDDCFIGANTTILLGTYITARTVIGANSLVTKSIMRPGVYVSPRCTRLELEEENSSKLTSKVDERKSN